MKIAIPTEEGKVAQHFGRSPQFTLVEILKDKVINTEVLNNPGHSPGAIPEFLKEKGVHTIIASGMGARAMEIFENSGIAYILGAEGSVDKVIEDFISGKLESKTSTCSEGSGKGTGIEKDGCGHHH